MSNKKDTKLGFSSLLLIVLAFIIYSTTGVFSKYASLQTIPSASYLGFIILVVFTMGIYAVLWQIILKKVSLHRAFLFKSLTVVFSLLFAWSIFHETITLKNMIGSGFIIAGIVLNLNNRTT